MTLHLELRDLGTVLVPDEQHGRDFGHHDRFRTRYSRAIWVYRRIEVAAASLLCQYPNLGDAQNPGGIVAALGGPDGGLAGIPLAAIAAQVRAKAQTEPGFLAYPAVQRIVRLMLLGPNGIYALPQALMLEPRQPTGTTVIEGNHRYLALLLLGHDRVEGYDWSQVALQE